MVIAIYFAAYKRLPILKICLEGIERLKRDHKDIEFLPFAVYSNPSEKKMLDKYGVRSLRFENDFLGAKKNAGLRELLKLDWDYLMEIGSDDLINSNLIDFYKPYWEEGKPCFGVRSCYFIDSLTGKTAFWKHDYAVGAGRCIKKTTLEAFDKTIRVMFLKSTPGKPKGREMECPSRLAKGYISSGMAKMVADVSGPFRLWTDTKNIALDGDSQYHLAENGFHVEALDVGNQVMVIDIKSGTNIHKFQAFEQCNKSVDELMRDFSKAERDGIRKLGQRN